MGQHGATILPSFFHLSFYLSNKFLSSGKVFTELPAKPEIQMFSVGPVGSVRIRWVPSVWKRPGKVESLQGGVGMVGKQSRFLPHNLPLLTADDSTNFLFWEALLKSTTQPFFTCFFLFLFFSFMEKSPNKIPRRKLFQAIFPGRRTVVFEHASASVNRIQQMWWDVTLVPWFPVDAPEQGCPGTGWKLGVCYITPQKKAGWIRSLSRFTNQLTNQLRSLPWTPK